MIVELEIRVVRGPSRSSCRRSAVRCVLSRDREREREVDRVRAQQKVDSRSGNRNSSRPFAQ